MKVSHSLSRLRRGGKDRALVGLKDIQPMRQVLRMVSARFNRDCKLRAKESCSKLGNEFFHRVGFATKSA